MGQPGLLRTEWGCRGRRRLIHEAVDDGVHRHAAEAVGAEGVEEQLDGDVVERLALAAVRTWSMPGHHHHRDGGAGEASLRAQPGHHDWHQMMHNRHRHLRIYVCLRHTLIHAQGHRCIDPQGRSPGTQRRVQITSRAISMQKEKRTGRDLLAEAADAAGEHEQVHAAQLGVRQLLLKPKLDAVLAALVARWQGGWFQL